MRNRFWVGGLRPAGLVAGLCLALLAQLSLAPQAMAGNPGPLDSLNEAQSADVALRQNHAALTHDPADQLIGAPKGDVTIVEFFDYACPFCKAAEPALETLLQSDRGVKLVVKELPILSPQSMVASKVALAGAKQGKYAAFHQALLLHKGPLNEAAIYGVARDVGLDPARLRADINAPDIDRQIAGNLALARAVHVSGTPTFIVDDHFLTQPSGQIDFAAVVAAARKDRARPGLGGRSEGE